MTRPKSDGKPTRDAMVAAGLFPEDDARDPTTDRSAAQVVIDWMTRSGWRYEFMSRNGAFKVAFAKPWKQRRWSRAKDECEAICRAALAMVEGNRAA